MIDFLWMCLFALIDHNVDLNINIVSEYICMIQHECIHTTLSGVIADVNSRHIMYIYVLFLAFEFKFALSLTFFFNWFVLHNVVEKWI